MRKKASDNEWNGCLATSRSTGAGTRDVNGNAENGLRDVSVESELDLFTSGAMSDGDSRMPESKKRVLYINIGMQSDIYRGRTVSESSQLCFVP